PVPFKTRDELSLYTKLLAPRNVTVEQFLTKAPEPPSSLLIKNAITQLKAMDAMDEFQDLTVLGHHLSDFPIEPRLVKMVLSSVMLKCLDPVLTIVCSLAHREPFLMPSQSSQGHAAWACRRKFAANTYSDHMVLLRAFQAWQKAYAEGWEQAFCERNYLSQGTMEMIVWMRAELLGQLRASGFVRAHGPGDIRDLNVNSDNWAVVKATLVAGLYPNVAHVNRLAMTLNTSSKQCLRFHQASVLSLPLTTKVIAEKNQQAVAALPTDWIVFDEMSHQHCQACLRCCSAVSTITIALFAGPARLPKNTMNELQSFPCKRYSLAVVLIVFVSCVPTTPSSSSCPLTAHLLYGHHMLYKHPKRLVCFFKIDTYVYITPPTLFSYPQSAAVPPTLKSKPTDTNPAPTRDTCKPSLSQKLPSAVPGIDSLASNTTTTTTNSQQSSRMCIAPDMVLPSSSSSKLQAPLGLAQMPGTPRYFLMKCWNHKFLELSKLKGIWSTSASIEHQLSKAFRQASHVFLIFTIQGSGNFQVVCDLPCKILQNQTQMRWPKRKACFIRTTCNNNAVV
uniref:YTH domain-containing protein n=1 Tax=Eptatretus burgeri TaxID=7764 RepID=A0A8C4NMV1_EPTBU